MSDEARVMDATARRDAFARSTRCTPRVMIELAVIEFADIVPPKCATTTVMEMDGNARSAVSISASLISRSPRDRLDVAQTTSWTPDTSHGRSRFFRGATFGPPTTRASHVQPVQLLLRRVRGVEANAGGGQSAASDAGSARRRGGCGGTATRVRRQRGGTRGAEIATEDEAAGADTGRQARATSRQRLEQRLNPNP